LSRGQPIIRYTYKGNEIQIMKRGDEHRWDLCTKHVDGSEELTRPGSSRVGHSQERALTCPDDETFSLLCQKKPEKKPKKSVFFGWWGGGGGGGGGGGWCVNLAIFLDFEKANSDRMVLQTKRSIGSGRLWLTRKGLDGTL